MSQKLMLCVLVLVALIAVANAQWGWGGNYGGYGGYDPLAGGPNRQWRRYYRCMNGGFCNYDWNTGRYVGRRELIRNLGGIPLQGGGSW